MPAQSRWMRLCRGQVDGGGAGHGVPPSLSRFVSHGRKRLSKKIEKIGDFFFAGCAALGTDGVGSGVSSLVPIVSPEPRCRKGTVAPRTGGPWWQGRAAGVPIAPPAAFHSTPFLQHHGSLLCLIHELFAAFPLHFFYGGASNLLSPHQSHPIPGPQVWVSSLSPETPMLGCPWAGAAGREGPVPPWHPHPVLPPGAGCNKWSQMAPSPPRGTFSCVASSKSPQKLFSNSFPMGVSIPHLFPCGESILNEVFPEQGSYRFEADLIKAAGRGTACFKFMGNT